MYIPEAFRESRPEILYGFVKANPLATLVTLGPDGLFANHIPLILETSSDGAATLRGHLSRANAQWKEFRSDIETLAIFQGPQTYVSPNWYATKEESGRVVPTWNFTAVHAYGALSIYSDELRLRAHLERLTAAHEGSGPSSWQIDDAPGSYIDGLLKAIVGVELRVSRLEGKWKVSQNRPAEDRASVAAALGAKGDPESLRMAALIRERDPKP